MRADRRLDGAARARVCLVLGVALATSGASFGAQSGRGRPNILIAIADDWSHGHAGAYGCGWVKTPAFDRVAREGVLFANAFTNNPKCSPCRASLLTGRNSWQLDEACNHFGVFPARWPVYTDLLEQAGYHVGFTGKGWGPGDFRSGGFKRNPAGQEFNRQRSKPPHRGVSEIDYARNFNDFLAARKPGQPFCFWYGGTEPHREYDEGNGRRLGKDPKAVKLPAYYPDSDVIRNDMLDYAVEVEWFDTQLGRILSRLEESGELDDTLVLVTSDHGMPFPRVKGQVYEHGVHLPLAVRCGRLPGKGRIVDDFVNVRDFAPTFLEAAGVERPKSITGRSFLDVLESGKSAQVDSRRDRVLLGKERHDLGRPFDQGYPVRAIRTRDYFYVLNYEPDRWPAGNPETGYRDCDDGPTKTLLISRFDESYRLCFGKRPREELYRVIEDPDCVKNLASEAGLRAVKQKLREEMEETFRQDGDPRALGRGAIFDTYEYVGPALHSYERWLKFQR
jgi:N-sulfoglucosamine sulfohydrolase